MLATDNRVLASANDIRKAMHCSLSWPCLSKKLNVSTASDIDLKLRKRVVEKLPAHLRIWLSKSFTNFTGTSHQLYIQKLVASTMCRQCGSHEEIDTLHVLCCETANLNVYRQEIINDL